MRREQRLSRGKAFDTAFAEGTVHRGPLLILRARANGLDTTRWGFAVGKRLHRRAVDRNRLRRRLRAIARDLPAAPGYDVIVVARSGALEASHPVLQSTLVNLLRRAGAFGEAT